MDIHGIMNRCSRRSDALDGLLRGGWRIGGAGDELMTKLDVVYIPAFLCHTPSAGPGWAVRGGVVSLDMKSRGAGSSPWRLPGLF